jgi:hypothetical protein
VDVSEIRRKYLIDVYGEGPDDFTDMVNQSSKDWMAGYHANTKQFTLEELKTAWAFGVEASSGFDELLKILRPLQIPQLLECNDDFTNIKITW